jgi:hypothetical protein
MQPGPKISAKGQQEPAVALRLGPTAPSATAMHELVRPRISTFAGGSRTPRPTDASTRAYAIPNSGKTAVHSWGRSPARQARRIKLLQHGNGELRVIYFESPGYTKRRVANPYREGVPNSLRPETHDTLTSGSSTFFTFMRKYKTSAGPTYVTWEPIGGGRTRPGVTAHRLPGLLTTTDSCRLTAWRKPRTAGLNERRDCDGTIGSTVYRTNPRPIHAACSIEEGPPAGQCTSDPLGETS